jgi:hypothetical protein
MRKGQLHESSKLAFPRIWNLLHEADPSLSAPQKPVQRLGIVTTRVFAD